MSTECPTCEKTCKNTRGVKLHHKIVHDESLAGYEYTCEVCGKTDRAMYEDRRFCSNKCEAKYREERATFTCEWCGVEKECLPNELEQKRFCSQDCHGEWQAKHRAGENHPCWQGGLVEIECHNCGGSAKRYRNEAEDNTNRFCSKDCFYEWHQGENAGNWKGGHDHNYGHTWPKQREKALERDGYTCRACGMDEQGHFEKYGRQLEVHHVIPFRKFDEEIAANSLENLVTVCKACHGKYEGLPVFPM